MPCWVRIVLLALAGAVVSARTMSSLSQKRSITPRNLDRRLIQSESMWVNIQSPNAASSSIIGLAKDLEEEETDDNLLSESEWDGRVNVCYSDSKSCDVWDDDREDKILLGRGKFKNVYLGRWETDDGEWVDAAVADIDVAGAVSLRAPTDEYQQLTALEKAEAEVVSVKTEVRRTKDAAAAYDNVCQGFIGNIFRYMVVRDSGNNNMPLTIRIVSELLGNELELDEPGAEGAYHVFKTENVWTYLALMYASTVGVHCAHRVGVLHRDIKPQNMMTPLHSQDQRSLEKLTGVTLVSPAQFKGVKLIDFGLATPVEAPEGLVGSLSFMPSWTGQFEGSEVVRAFENPEESGAKYDVYALGVAWRFLGFDYLTEATIGGMLVNILKMCEKCQYDAEAKYANSHARDHCPDNSGDKPVATPKELKKGGWLSCPDVLNDLPEEGKDVCRMHPTHMLRLSLDEVLEFLAGLIVANWKQLKNKNSRAPFHRIGSSTKLHDILTLKDTSDSPAALVHALIEESAQPHSLPISLNGPPEPKKAKKAKGGVAATPGSVRAG